MSRRGGHYATKMRRKMRAIHRSMSMHGQTSRSKHCKQCQAPLVTEQDQEIGYCYDCWQIKERQR